MVIFEQVDESRRWYCVVVKYQRYTAVLMPLEDRSSIREALRVYFTVAFSLIFARPCLTGKCGVARAMF